MVQYVLIFGSDSYFITPHIMQALVRLINWVAQLISDWMPWCRNGQWEYPQLVKKYRMWVYILLGGISPNATLVRHSISPRCQYLTLQWQRVGGKDPQRPYFRDNRREYGSEMRVGVHMSHRWSGNNIIVLITIQY